MKIRGVVSEAVKGWEIESRIEGTDLIETSLGDSKSDFEILLHGHYLFISIKLQERKLFTSFDIINL